MTLNNKRATLRFYEELNDFLSPSYRKRPIDYWFNGERSIKDVIESLGVPHVEVDIILVNGQSVGFDYLLKHKDNVSVYPVFETLNISGLTHLREAPLREVRFILDVHLGKLDRYLRTLGFDTLYQNDNDDNEIVRLSLLEQRIILTRDIGLLKIKMVTHGYFVRSQLPREQIKEVLDHFDLYDAIQPFTRCIRCNGPLKPVDKATVMPLLEPLTKQYFEVFTRCTSCGQVYWEGSHLAKMNRFIEAIKAHRTPKDHPTA
jgi:uncharacterized protein with PIN domain